MQRINAAKLASSSLPMCAQGFRLLLASPDAGYKVFRGLQKDGHGDAKLFDGRSKPRWLSAVRMQEVHSQWLSTLSLISKGVEDEATEKETVNEILENESLREQNSYVQVRVC